MYKSRVVIVVLMLSLCAAAFPAGRDKRGPLVLERVFAYSSTVDTTGWGGNVSYSYMKYDIQTRRRNFVLLAVPTMFAVAHAGEREHVGEGYDRVTVSGNGRVEARRMLERSTVPHRSRTMPTLLKYLTPYVYGETVIGEDILSPFFRSNRRYYRYRISSPDDTTAVIRFRPRIANTQLVRGTAFADPHTGRIRRVVLDGEYDMVRFRVDVAMGRKGVRSLMPDSCRLNATFKFLGNNITTEYHSFYGLPKTISDTVQNRRDTTLLRAVRPVPLTAYEQNIYNRSRARSEASSATAATKKKSFTSRVAQMLWDNVGERLLNKVRSDFGSKGQGSFRINPILNPLYFGYSGRKGFTYKFDVRANWFFSSNTMVSTRLKSGYSFRQKQFYFQIPLTFYYDVKHNGYIEAEVRNGNRITNSTVIDDIKNEETDSIDWDRMNLTYFNDFSFHLVANYDFSDRFGLRVGTVLNRRTAVHEDGFKTADRPTSYVSAAPTVELTVRPWGYAGPVFVADYERSIRGMYGANIEYERYEFDGQYTRRLSALSCLQMRLGTGFYTHKGKDWYFLDYTNFHDNNIPGGWNDEWACDFELLGSNWYNISKYYVRANITYESPLLMLSRLPWVGRFMEKERIYLSALAVTRLHPYMEYGYGFSTRLFSMGFFVAQRNGRYDGIGLKFGLELFRRW